jgi:hypothetical protein
MENTQYKFDEIVKKCAELVKYLNDENKSDDSFHH